jgi:hypothetical protein
MLYFLCGKGINLIPPNHPESCLKCCILFHGISFTEIEVLLKPIHFNAVIKAVSFEIQVINILRAG